MAVADAWAWAEPLPEAVAVPLAQALPPPLEDAWALAAAEALEPLPPRSLRWSAAMGKGGGTWQRRCAGERRDLRLCAS